MKQQQLCVRISSEHDIKLRVSLDLFINHPLLIVNPELRDILGSITVEVYRRKHSLRVARHSHN